MDKVFIYAYPSGFKEYVVGCAINKDRRCFASHMSSNIDWTQHDMGIGSDWKHDIYSKEYPDGYELVWLGLIDSDKEFVEIAGAAGVDVSDIL